MTDCHLEAHSSRFPFVFSQYVLLMTNILMDTWLTPADYRVPSSGQEADGGG